MDVCMCVMGRGGFLGVNSWRVRESGEGFSNGDEGGRKVRGGGELEVGRGGRTSKNWGEFGGC